jgi:hypothetical protein
MQKLPGFGGKSWGNKALIHIASLKSGLYQVRVNAADARAGERNGEQ